MVCFVQNKTKVFSEKESEKMCTKMFILGTSEYGIKGDFLKMWTSLVAQWLRIPMPTQGTRGPWAGKVPRAMEQLGPWAAAAEACAPRACAPQRDRHHNDRPARCEGVALAQCSWRKPAQGHKDPVQPKLNKIIKTSCCLHFLLFYNVRALIM